MKLLIAVLLTGAGVVQAAATHGWCGSIAPGKGLRLVREANVDRMCGFLQAKHSGAHNFTATVQGTRVWIGKTLVAGPVTLQAEAFYAISIEAPASADFRLKWDQPLGVPVDIPPTVLFQPTATVKPGCEAML
jgi:hypothetical protein